MDPIIASAEFDPKTFITGIDQMTSALERLSSQEDKIRQDLTNINTALAANRKELKATEEQLKKLDQSSASYNEELATLTTQQTTLTKQQDSLKASLKTQRDQLGQVHQSANDYKAALVGLNAVSKQVTTDNKGRTLFDIASMQQQIKDITTIGAKYKDIFKGKIDTKELDELEDKLVNAKGDFDKLREVVEFTAQKLDTLDPNSEAFQELSQVINTGRQILEDYGQVEENVGKRSESLSGRLRVVRNELANMIDSGMEGTEQFKQLQHEAAELQDAIDKAGERVRTFANDTRLIQGGIELLRGFAAATELVAGTTALFGVNSEAAEETIKRLTAIMAVANGLQEISNLLKKESVVRLVAEEVATKAYAISQRILAATLGTTAAASRALSIALAATGIGAIVVAIGLIVTALSHWADAAKEAAFQQELLNAATETGIKINESFVDAIGDAGKKFLAQAELRQAVNQKITDSDIENLKIRAANAQELRNIELKTLEDQLAEVRKFERAERANFDRAANRRREALEGRIEISDDELDQLNKTIDNFTKVQETGYQLENQLELRRLNNLRDQARERNELQRAELSRTNDFLKRLEELRKRLLDAQNRQQRQNEAQLAKQSADNLRSELRKIDADVRKGQLTRAQGVVLKSLLRQINGVELTTELKEFRKKSLEAEQNIQDQITNLRLRVGEQRANLIRDELQLEAALIAATYEQERQELANAQRDALKGVQEVLDQGLISPVQAEANADQIKLVYDRLFNQLAEQTTRRQEELTAKAFQQAQAQLTNLFANVQLAVTEAATDQIQEQTRRFISGRIRYERYQRELTKILQQETDRRIKTSLRENEALLEAVLARIKLEKDPARLKDLQTQERELRAQIAELKRQLAAANVAGVQGDRKELTDRVNTIAAYATAIGSIAEQVVGFWDRANKAEQEQLDRSISLQEKRVEAATRIAERGNAEYLRLEEDRLDELRLKQENAARRQLAINAILQTSQALTAFVTALAQGIATGGPLGGLAIAAAVLSAIASGYAIVQSLQPEPQSFFKGTKRVERNGAPAGVDTVPAMLTEGETVLPAGTAHDYRPAVDAIYDRAIPPDQLNSFVNAYRVNRRTIPGLNHERIGEVAQVTVTYDGELLEATQSQTRRLEEHNDLLRNMDKTLKGMGISLNIDRHGLAISLMKAVQQANIDKKA